MPANDSANQDNQSLGSSLRMRRVRLDEQIYFKEHICDEFMHSRYPLPDKIMRARNRAIQFGFIELICCLACLIFYERRRSKIILFLILMTWISTGCGFQSKLRLSYYGLLLHSCFTISFLGGFYIYILIDLALGTERNSNQDTSHGLNDTTVLIITSLPFLMLFILGMYTLRLVFMLDDELEARKRAETELVNFSGSLSGSRQPRGALR